MTQNTDILIIGGGISGYLTARELALAGRQVTILDKSLAGQEASWAGGGILLPIYPWRQAAAISDLAIQSLESYPKLSQELLAATGIDPEWHQCGMLICKNPDSALSTSWCTTHNIQHQPCPTAFLEGLDTTMDQPLWLPEIAQARNPRLLKSLHAYLKQLGVEIIEQIAIHGMEMNQGRITQVHTAQQRFTPNQLVLCAGAWTAELLKQWLPDSPLALSIQPVRGQMLLFDAEPETLSHMILDGDHYLIPRRDGKILAGSTVEQSGFEKHTTQEAAHKLKQFATRLLPAIKEFPICAHWAGLRPGTPQGIPYIGYHPDADNLSVNAGHFRNGLVMGPAAAALLTDLILQRQPRIDPTPYALAR